MKNTFNSLKNKVSKTQFLISIYSICFLAYLYITYWFWDWFSFYATKKFWSVHLTNRSFLFNLSFLFLTVIIPIIFYYIYIRTKDNISFKNKYRKVSKQIILGKKTEAYSDLLTITKNMIIKYEFKKVNQDLLPLIKEVLDIRLFQQIDYSIKKIIKLKNINLPEVIKLRKELIRVIDNLIVNKRVN